MRRIAPSGVRCTATLLDGARCRWRYVALERPALCSRHHRMLRRYLAAFDRAPEHWTALAPRNWRASFRGGQHIGANGFARFLVSEDGEPIAVNEAGCFVGVDSAEIYPRAVVAERVHMHWLVRLDRTDVRRALRLAATRCAGETLELRAQGG